MSAGKLSKLKNIFTKNGSCGSEKSTNASSPGPKSRTSDQKLRRCPSSLDNKHGGGNSAIDAAPRCPLASVSPKSWENVTARLSPKIYNSLAIVKDSDDPYGDFRRSMMQMIVDGEIYSRIELEQLLECFLRLNSPELHGTIFRAFEELWDGRESPSAAVRADGACSS